MHYRGWTKEEIQELADFMASAEHEMISQRIAAYADKTNRTPASVEAQYYRMNNQSTYKTKDIRNTNSVKRYRPWGH